MGDPSYCTSGAGRFHPAACGTRTVVLGRPIVVRRSLRARRTRYLPLRDESVIVTRGVTPAGDRYRPLAGSVTVATGTPASATSTAVPPRVAGNPAGLMTPATLT